MSQKVTENLIRSVLSVAEITGFTPLLAFFNGESTRDQTLKNEWKKNSIPDTANTPLDKLLSHFEVASTTEKVT